MFELLTGFDLLAEQVPSTNGRLAVTVAATGAFLLVLLSYRELQGRLAQRTRALYADILSTILLVGVSILTVGVILGVWGQTGEIRALYGQHDLGGAFVARVVFSFVLLVSTYLLTRFVHRVIRDVVRSSSAVTDHQQEISRRLSQVVIWSVSLIVILGIWVDDLGGLLVGAGFLGIVVGMAARQTLSALIAGFVLMFSRPFEIGDWIHVEGNEGVVTDVSIVNTRIKSFDGEYVMIPNDVIGSSVVTNRSKRGRLRLEIDVGIDYDADVERASTLAEAAIETVDDAASAPEPSVVTKAFGDSSVLLGVRFWIDDPTAKRATRARTAAIRSIKDTFDENDVTIPYPQRQLSGRTAMVEFDDGSPTGDGGDDDQAHLSDGPGSSAATDE